jgi:hypothetical protein
VGGVEEQGEIRSGKGFEFTVSLGNTDQIVLQHLSEKEEEWRGKEEREE